MPQEIQEKIIGRVEEKELLQELIDSKKAEFIAIYGRRRVGKTYLIRQFMQSMPCRFFHMTGLQKGKLSEQLEEFARQIGITFYEGAPVAVRRRWRDAFEDLTAAIDKVPKKEKVVLFFDEFPWMATPRSKLIMALELYWNRYWVFEPRLKLVICGSATSWIIENVINNKGGLHNRITRTIHLKPFSLSETESLLKERKIPLNRRQILDLYIVLGGIPLYWSFISKGQSAHQAIHRLCFQSGGPLVKEFNRLFSSLFEDPKPYMALIEVLARHRYGIGQVDLIKAAKLPNGGSAIRRLHQLEDAGFIKSVVPYGHKQKGVYYLIDDEYSLFYLKWIAPEWKSIGANSLRPGFWVAESTHTAWKVWAGLAFESLCYKHIDQICHALKLNPGSRVGTWRYTPKSKEDEGAQIDLLFDRPDGAITICEIKYSDRPFAIDKAYAKTLLKKMEIFKKRTKTDKQLFLAMITTAGLKETMYSEEIVSSQVVLDDLFRE